MLLLGGLAAWGQDSGVSVKVQDPKIETRKFDPKNPPAEMPKLTADEAAVTASQFGVASEFKVVVLGDQAMPDGKHRAKVKVESVTVRPNLKVIEWVPEGGSQRLTEHEDGHREISVRFYKESEKVARDIAQGFVGKVLLGEDGDTEAARRAAIHKGISELSDQYMKAVEAPAARVNELYDTITDHGRNEKFPPKKAIEMAMKRYHEEAGRAAER